MSDTIIINSTTEPSKEDIWLSDRARAERNRLNPQPEKQKRPQLQLQINETKANLICLEQGDMSCKDCCFETTEDCTGIACSDHERQDKKHVIYKVIRGEDECIKDPKPIS